MTRGALRLVRTDEPAPTPSSRLADLVREQVEYAWSDVKSRDLTAAEHLQYSIFGAGTIHPNLGLNDARRCTRALAGTLIRASRTGKRRIAEMVANLWQYEGWEEQFGLSALNDIVEECLMLHHDKGAA